MHKAKSLAAAKTENKQMRTTSKAKASKAKATITSEAIDTIDLSAIAETLLSLPATDVATVTTDKATQAALARETLIIARNVSRTAYSGSSLAVRFGNPKLAKLIENTKTPKQHTDAINARDLSYLRTLRTTYAACVNTATGEFDGVTSHLDAGVASHLSLHGKTCLTPDGRGLMLTPAGLALLATA